MKYSIASVTLSAAIIVSSLAVAPAVHAGNKDKEIQAAKQLVWPLPPDKPRYRWVEQLSNVKDYENKKFSFVDRMVGGSKAGPETMFRPIGVAADSKGRIIVAAQTTRVVYVIDKDHKQVLRIQGSQTMPFKQIMGVATDDKDNIYVADSKQKSVMRFSPDGVANASFGTNDGLENPSYIAVDNGRRRIYVTDTHKHQVFVYNLDSLKVDGKIGKPGSKKGELSYPIGVAVNPKTGDVAVSNTETCSVEIFSPEYKWKKRVGECGTQLGMFTRPKGVAYDSEGNLYVVDFAFNNFQVFDPEGHLRMFVGTSGLAPGSFYLPNAIYIDRNDRVYVSEFYGNRVQVFQFLGSK